MLGDIDHLFEGNVRCFLIKIKGGNPGIFKKKFGRVLFSSTLLYVRADFLLDSVTTWVIRVLYVYKQILDKVTFLFYKFIRLKYV